MLSSCLPFYTCKDLLQHQTQHGIMVTGGSGVTISRFLQNVDTAWKNKEEAPQNTVHFNRNEPIALQYVPWINPVSFNFNQELFNDE